MSLKAIARTLSEPVRAYTPALYDYAIKKLSSERVRTLRNLHKLPGENRLVRSNAPIFAADLGSRQGFGSTLSWAAEVLAYCEAKNLTPALRFSNPVYAQTFGEDWLRSYFDLKVDMPELPFDRYMQQSVNLRRRLKADAGLLSIQHAHDLFFSVLDFRSSYYEEVDQFCKARAIGSNTVGVHFRGTDKRLEATRPDWEMIALQVQTLVSASRSNIFVATDEPEFLAFMRERFSGRVDDLECQEIFAGKSAHLTAGNPAVKASEAIRTIITLSRCGTLVRTRSHLSAWAKILNPAIPTIVFGKMLHGDKVGFPEAAIPEQVHQESNA